MAKLVWEKVEEENIRYRNPDAQRAKVPGGWILKVDIHNSASGITFVPDPDHSWE